MSRDNTRGALPESRESLWLLILSPVIWSLHFLLCYVTVAVWCAKVAGRDGNLGASGVAVAVFTAIALLAIGCIAWRGWQRSKRGLRSLPLDADTAPDRQYFLGFATLLLSGLSFVATIYVALAAVMIRSCV